MPSQQFDNISSIELSNISYVNTWVIIHDYDYVKITDLTKDPQLSGCISLNQVGSSITLVQSSDPPTIFDQPNKRFPSLMIVVPRGMPIKADYKEGNLYIGSTMGPVDITYSGTKEVIIGYAHDAKVNLKSDEGMVIIRDVEGLLDLTLEGSGSIEVTRSKVNSLVINNHRKGIVCLEGSANEVNITQNDEGYIKLHGQIASPSVKGDGAGILRVWNR